MRDRYLDPKSYFGLDAKYLPLLQHSLTISVLWVAGRVFPVTHLPHKDFIKFSK